jgi:hypothetical protein
MTVAEIQSVVASYLQKSVDRFNVAGTDVNLVLLAMNNARKYAERRHNWNACRKKGYFSVNPGTNKVVLDSPTWFDGGTEKLKEGKHWWIRGSSDVVNETVDEDQVLKVIDQGVKYRLEADKEYGGTWWEERYGRQDRVEEVHHPLLMQPYAISRGKWIELYPKPTTQRTVVVDGYYWWPNWSLSNSGKIERVWEYSLDTVGYAEAVWYYFTLALGDTDVIQLGVPTTGSVPAAVPYAMVNTNPSGVMVGTLTASVEYVNRFLKNGTLEYTAGGTKGKVTLRGTNPDFSLTYWRSSGTLVTVSKTLVSEQNLLLDYSDWWTENAEEYLILRSLVEANRLGQAFVGNKEGNLPPPVKEAEAALELLIRQDEDMKLAGGAIELY